MKSHIKGVMSMSLKTDELITEIKDKYPTFTTDQIIALVQSEAMLRMVNEGFNLYIELIEPVEVKACRQ